MRQTEIVIEKSAWLSVGFNPAIQVSPLYSKEGGNDDIAYIY